MSSIAAVRLLLYLQAMGMDKSDELAKEAFKVLQTASKIRDFRLDALDTLRGLMALIRKGGAGGASVDVYQVNEAVANAREAGIAVRHWCITRWNAWTLS